MNPIMMIPSDCGDNNCCIESLEGELESDIMFDVSGIIKVEIITTIPINAPPMINKVVTVFDLILNPIAYEIKNRIIDPPPNIMPLSFNERGKNPSPLFNLAIPASAIYITSKIKAIETIISAAVFLFVCINTVIFFGLFNYYNQDLISLSFCRKSPTIVFLNL